MQNLGKKDKWEKNGYISEIAHVCPCILGLGGGSKKGREHKNITALNLSFKIFKLNFHVDGLPECSATLCIPKWDSIRWRVRGSVVKFSSLLALCDEGRLTEVVHK